MTPQQKETIDALQKTIDCLWDTDDPENGRIDVFYGHMGDLQKKFSCHTTHCGNCEMDITYSCDCPKGEDHEADYPCMVCKDREIAQSEKNWAERYL